MKPAKLFLVLLLTISMLSLTGCWNYREVENLAMVTGIAVDKGENGYLYHLTFEFLDPTEQQPKAKLLETDGNTIFDAVRNAISISERKLYFSDAKILIISKDIAAQGVAPIFDWMLRDQEPRITLIPAVAKTKTAGEVFQQEGVTEPLVSLEIFRTITQNKTALSETSSVELFEAVNLMSGEGSSMVLAAIKSSKMQDKQVSELDGSAVFKADRLIGFLGREESKFYLFTRNEVKGGLLAFSPNNDGQNIALEIQGSNTKITSEVKDGKPTIHIQVDVKAALAEDGTQKNYVDEAGLMKADKSAENYLKSGVEQLIKKVQTQYDSDIFGFGNIIYKHNPEYWNKNKEQWDKEFKKLNCTVEAKVQIDNTATTKDKIKVGK